MQGAVDEFKPMAVEVLEGFQPPFTLHGVLRNPCLARFNPCKGNNSSRVQNLVSPGDLLESRKCGVDERVDLLGMPASANDARSQIALNRANGPNCGFRPIGPDALQDQNRNWLSHVRLEPSSLPDSLEPTADRGDGQIPFCGGRDMAC